MHKKTQFSPFSTHFKLNSKISLSFSFYDILSHRHKKKTYFFFVLKLNNNIIPYHRCWSEFNTLNGVLFFVLTKTLKSDEIKQIKQINFFCFNLYTRIINTPSSCLCVYAQPFTSYSVTHYTLFYKHKHYVYLLFSPTVFSTPVFRTHFVIFHLLIVLKSSHHNIKMHEKTGICSEFT